MPVRVIYLFIYFLLVLLSHAMQQVFCSFAFSAVFPPTELGGNRVGVLGLYLYLLQIVVCGSNTDLMDYLLCFLSFEIKQGGILLIFTTLPDFADSPFLLKVLSFCNRLRLLYCLFLVFFFDDDDDDSSQ